MLATLKSEWLLLHLLSSCMQGSILPLFSHSTARMKQKLAGRGQGWGQGRG